jgi:hypothetical protein
MHNRFWLLQLELYTSLHVQQKRYCTISVTVHNAILKCQTIAMRILCASTSVRRSVQCLRDIALLTLVSGTSHSSSATQTIPVLLALSAAV